MFPPLQCSNMDMIDADDKLSQVAATYNLNEEKLLTQWRLFRRTAVGGRTSAACDIHVPHGSTWTWSTASWLSSTSHITCYKCWCRTSVFEAFSDQVETTYDNGSGKTGIADVVHDGERHRAYWRHWRLNILLPSLQLQLIGDLI